MKKWSFEELDVWKLSRELNMDLWRIFYNSAFKNFSFQDQIMRAWLSVQNNIAEWNESQSNKEFIKFLYYSKRSSGEVRSMLYNALDYWYLQKEEFDKFYQWYIWLSVKIFNLIRYLKNQI